MREVSETGTSHPIRSRVVLLPLRAEARMVGAIAAFATEPFMLDVARGRLLAAFGFYAALGLERARLMAAAAQSARLREMQRARDEIFASVSHDLRTPLTTIKALAQNELGDGHAAAVRIVEQVDRLARMVGDLLDTSRLRTGGIVLHPVINTAEDLIGAAFRRAEGLRNGRKLSASFDLEAPALAGLFDFVQTLRALGNLIDNGLRHSPAGGVVEVRCTRAGDSLVFSVADRGPGVAVEERQRIFDAFYRPADAVADTGHAGPGLAIARSLAQVQGGDVSFRPREGGGSVFELRLPAADLDVGEAELDARDEESFAEIFDDG
jgi:Osmosensitive K+ channel histidine kinase